MDTDDLFTHRDVDREDLFTETERDIDTEDLLRERMREREMDTEYLLREEYILRKRWITKIYSERERD